MSSRLLSMILKIKIYNTTILHIVLYGCEIWPLTLREELTLNAFQNIVLRRIFAPKREEVDGGWRRLHSEELHNLYTSPNVIMDDKDDEMGVVCSTHGRD
jgi:hypothetical protein